MKYSSRELFKAKHHYSRMVVSIDLGGSEAVLSNLRGSSESQIGWISAITRVIPNCFFNRNHSRQSPWLEEI